MKNIDVGKSKFVARRGNNTPPWEVVALPIVEYHIPAIIASCATRELAKNLAKALNEQITIMVAYENKER